MPENNRVDMADIEIAVIGGGVIGLAIGRSLALAGREVVIIEREEKYGMGMSSRNSEVIHAGIYYPPNSLKSRLCIKGRDLLYNYLGEKGVPHKNCGKLIVAADPREKEHLERLKKNAERAGNIPLEMISEDKLRKIEPNVTGVAALWSPSSGILDVHSYMDALAGDFRQAGGEFVFNSRVSAIKPVSDGYEVSLETNGEEQKYIFGSVINSAGLHADEVAEMAGFFREGDRLFWCKGNYFRLKAKKEYGLKHLVYPVPPKELAGLGIHATIDLNGGARFGPDVNYLSERKENFSVDESSKDKFIAAVKRYMPQILKEDLFPDMAGIRGKRQGPGDSFKDFVIRSEKEKGHPRFINLIGMESPGLTASLAIGELVEKNYFRVN